MRVDRARLTPFRLPLRAPLATAHGVLTERCGLLLSLEAEGHRGLGEASPIPGFGQESTKRCRDALEAGVRRQVDGADRPVGDRLDALQRDFPGAPAARAAVDSALHDLAARLEGVSVAARLCRANGTSPRSALEVNALAVGASTESLARSARRACEEGHRCVKLKVGAGDPGRDIERVAAVRAAIGVGPLLRIDANEGLPEARSALALLERLSAFEIELIEQPLRADDLAGAAWLRERSPVAIAADEAATDESAARAVIEAGAADWLVVKPAACGGLAAASRIAGAAERAGVGVIVTSLIDSSVGIAAAAHFAASLPGPLPACGLATARLLERDLCDLPSIFEGSLPIPRGAGLGVGVPAARLAAVACGDAVEIAACAA